MAASSVAGSGLISVGGAAPAQTSSNLLTNPSFENGLNAWSVRDPQGSEQKPGSVEATGSAAKMNVSGAPSTILLEQQFNTDFPKGSTLQLEVETGGDLDCCGHFSLYFSKNPDDYSSGENYTLLRHPSDGSHTVSATAGKDFKAGDFLRLRTSIWPGSGYTLVKDINWTLQQPIIEPRTLSFKPFPVQTGEAPKVRVDIANVPSNTHPEVTATLQNGKSGTVNMTKINDGPTWEAKLSKLDNDKNEPDLTEQRPGTKVDIEIKAGSDTLNKTSQAFPETELPQTNEHYDSESLHYFIFDNREDIPVIVSKFRNQNPRDSIKEDLQQWERAREFDINSYLGSGSGAMGKTGFDFIFYDNNGDFYEVSTESKYKGSKGVETFIEDAKSAYENQNESITGEFIATHPGEAIGSAITHSHDINPFECLLPPRSECSLPRRTYAAMGFKKETHWYGTWVHEIGHLKFDLADLYDEDEDDDGKMEPVGIPGDIGIAGLMGGGYGFPHDTLPAPITGISRTVLNNNNWLDVEEVYRMGSTSRGSPVIQDPNQSRLSS